MHFGFVPNLMEDICSDLLKPSGGPLLAANIVIPQSKGAFIEPECILSFMEILN